MKRQLVVLGAVAAFPVVAVAASVAAASVTLKIVAATVARHLSPTQGTS